MGCSSTRGWVVVAMAASLALACAKRTDERVRAAWGNGSKTPGAGPGSGVDPGDEPGGDSEGEPVRVGWDRLDEIVDGAVAEASLGTDDEVMARLAERWCEVTPEPVPTDDGPVLVCIPHPPVQIDGHAFSLELGGEGVIGLVATELSLEDSSALANEALHRTERWCTSPWTDATSRPITEPMSPSPTARPTARAAAGPTDASLYTCPVEGSALLVVGRLVSSEETGTWQVSVTVLDAS